MAATSAESDMARFAPAASTFAPSRKDVLSSLAFFFGDPASPEKLRDYSEHTAATCAHANKLESQIAFVRIVVSKTQRISQCRLCLLYFIIFCRPFSGCVLRPGIYYCHASITAFNASTSIINRVDKPMWFFRVCVHRTPAFATP